MVHFHSVLKDEITTYLAVRKTVLSESAYKHDVGCLSSFDAFLVHIGLPEKAITEPIVIKWQGTLTGKSITKAGKIIMVRTFFKYLRSLGVSVYMPVVPKIADDYIPYVFSNEELERIFTAADNSLFTKGQQNPFIKTEIPMIFRILYGCGLRIGETLALQMQDVDLQNGILTLTHVKNKRHRLVPMSPSLAEIVRRYCMAMGIIGTPDAYLFPRAHPTRPLSIRSVRNRFDVITKNLRIALPHRKRHERGPCLHCLRHVFVLKSFSKAQANGRAIDDSIPFLSIYLGHDSLQETEKYLKFSSEMFPNALELFDNYAGKVFPEAEHEK